MFYFYSLQDLSSLAWDQTQAMAVKAKSLNHWTTREFPIFKHARKGSVIGEKISRTREQEVVGQE